MTPPDGSTWSRLRLRQTAHLRDLCAETEFTAAHFVQPFFVIEGARGAVPIQGLGDNARLGETEMLDVIGADLKAGVRHFLMFAVPREKRAGELSFAHAARPAAAIKRAFGNDLHLWVDVCLCSSTEHGHCAIVDAKGDIDLPPTLDALTRYAIEVADAGADGVSPSDMMDGRVRAMRAGLDAAGHQRVPIMSYSTKFASRFYGPFRNAADSSPKSGDRRHYQIDVRSRTDAIQSSVRCAAEGADLLMVKPGMTSIDLIAPIAAATGKLVGAYQVSGEYASLVGLAREGLADFDAALVETWQVFRRAGAAYVISYGARRARALGFGA